MKKIFLMTKGKKLVQFILKNSYKSLTGKTIYK